MKAEFIILLFCGFGLGFSLWALIAVWSLRPVNIAKLIIPTIIPSASSVYSARQAAIKARAEYEASVDKNG